METKAVISIISSVIVLAAIAGAAYYFLFYVGGDELKSDLEEGDFVEYTVTVDGLNSTLRHTITAVNGDGTYQVHKKEGSSEIDKTMTKSDFFKLLKMSGSDLNDLEKQTFTEKINTSFGEIRCKVYSGKVDLLGVKYDAKAYVGKDDVLYKAEIEGLITMTLKDTSLFD